MDRPQLASSINNNSDTLTVDAHSNALPGLEVPSTPALGEIHASPAAPFFPLLHNPTVYNPYATYDTLNLYSVHDLPKSHHIQASCPTAPSSIHGLTLCSISAGSESVGDTDAAIALARLTPMNRHIIYPDGNPTTREAPHGPKHSQLHNPILGANTSVSKEDRNVYRKVRTECEQLRRNKERDGFAMLKSVMPSSRKGCKASLLIDAATYIQQLEKRLDAKERELTQLRNLTEVCNAVDQCHPGAIVTDTEPPASAFTYVFTEFSCPNPGRRTSLEYKH